MEGRSRALDPTTMTGLSSLLTPSDPLPNHILVCARGRRKSIIRHYKSYHYVPGDTIRYKEMTNSLSLSEETNEPLAEYLNIKQKVFENTILAKV